MAPVLIGTSAEKTVTGTGPQTLTFTEADLPAGVLLGDRIVSIIHFWSEYNVYASYPTLPSGWSDDEVGVGPLRHLRPASDPASVGYRGMDDLLVRSQHPGPPALLSPEIVGHCHVDVGDEPLIPGVAELAEPSRVNLEHLGAT